MNDKGPINYVPLYFMYIIIVMKEVQYAVVTYNVGQRFLRLNKSLENILKSGRITNQFRKDLGLGASRSVYSSESSFGALLSRKFDVFFF